MQNRGKEMTEKEKYVLISDLAFVAREYVSEAIMGMRDTNSALQIVDSLLYATVIIRNQTENNQ